MVALPPLMRKEYVSDRYWCIVPIINSFLRPKFSRDKDKIKRLQTIRLVHYQWEKDLHDLKIKAFHLNVNISDYIKTTYVNPIIFEEWDVETFPMSHPYYCFLRDIILYRSGKLTTEPIFISDDCLPRCGWGRNAWSTFCHFLWNIN